MAAGEDGRWVIDAADATWTASASTTSTSLRSADCIIAWKPGRSSVAPDIA